jgi:hypothetical protein
MIPLWLKIAYTVPTLVILVVYWFKYGPGNYLWFSDIALIGLMPALWLESGLIASVLAVSVLIPELVWNFSYFGRLVTGRRITGLTEYMFEKERPTYLRMLSFFHVPIPPLLIWLLWKFGYDERALWIQFLVCWIVLPMSYWLTPPGRNVNWVRAPGGENEYQQFMPPLAWLALAMFGVFPMIYVATHFLLKLVF